MADVERSDPDGFPESGYVEQISQLAYSIWCMKVGAVESDSEQPALWGSEMGSEAVSARWPSPCWSCPAADGAQDLGNPVTAERGRPFWSLI